MAARAKHALVPGVVAALDSCISSLQWLRSRARGADDAEERRDGGLCRPRNHGTPTQRAADPEVQQAIAPRRRLRGLLVYLSVMLTGGMGGTVLAYDLLARLLDHRSAEIGRQEIKISKFSKSVAGLKRELDSAQAKRTEAETQFAAAAAEDGKKLAEQAALRAEAETRLASALAGRASNPRWQEEPRSRRGAARGGQTGWTKAGDCTLGSGNIRSVLNGCIADMDRK